MRDDQQSIVNCVRQRMVAGYHDDPLDAQRVASMTRPTQAQTKAAMAAYTKKKIEMYGDHPILSEADRMEAMSAAIAAAAAAEMDSNRTNEFRRVYRIILEHENKTIERCAHWLTEEAKALRSQVSGGDGSESQWQCAKALDRAAVCILALKDEVIMTKPTQAQIIEAAIMKTTYPSARVQAAAILNALWDAGYIIITREEYERINN